MTKLAIFDLDGTLLNTIDDLAAACNHALKVCGYPERGVCEYNTLVGRGIYNLFRGALPEGHRTDEDVRKMADIFIPYYDAHKCDMTRPYDGIPEMLRKLSDAGVMIAVASNKYQEGAESVVSGYFGDCGFIKVLGQREGHPIKPDPGIIMEIMDFAGVDSKDEVVYAGDSNVDMETGLNAGVRTAGVTWGFRSREELAAYSPWKLADSPEELCGIILA
ncbi:MAG: HAD family hydrolase [Bacteroidales bacterium]|nr:HAD family hydrolase [Bacteroides sp.]MCM1198724.1 HAD family hydrolase [Clostridium sp.]MCM1501845.1 HAD family hydrolase [Bacteroidales bacterium]